MNILYPLKFKAIFKDKIWGGDKIKTVLKKDFSPLSNCGEVWVLSGVKGNQTLVENGFLAGNELNELVEIYMGDLVGEKVFEKFGDEFPILLKFIDANAWLSIQVHPDDDLAKKRGLDSGKTEMWYILNAGENSELISGFSKKVNQETYLQNLKNKTLKDILNFEKVKQGDVFYMPSGRVHAIGPEILLAEIQQTSDITYRIYDWDRVDDKGNSRELHTDLALDALDFEVQKDYRTHYRQKINETATVVDSKYFSINILEFDRGIKKDYSELDSFVIYICTEGEMNIEYPVGNINLKFGDVLLIPNVINDINIFPVKHSKLLEVFIK